jgi:Nif-specific regulatory protein
MASNGQDGGQKPEQAPVQEVALAASRYLTRGVELDALLVAMVDTIVRSVGADRGTLYLVDGGEGKLTSKVAHLPEIDAIVLKIGQGIAGTVAKTGVALKVDDPANDSRFDPTTDEKTGYTTTSLLAVPIKDGQENVIGVLQLLNAASGTFGEKDENAATELAQQAGRVLENTSLYASLKAKSPLPGARPKMAYRFNQIVGESPAMQRVYTLVKKAAATDATVLITGESGTGKELIARAVHVNSNRREAPFVKVDCTTLPESLIENELFGHEKGSFTGADKTVRGKFEVADGGTLFIDEIGELPLQLQGKLLRAIQDREFERVGGTRTIHTDIRVIVATHRDLEKMVREQRFREDLYYRIRVVPIGLPPLRERGTADRVRLINHFVDRFTRRHGRVITRIADGAMDRLLSHAFPGNIRELENCIESAVVLANGSTIDVQDLPLPSPERSSPPGDAAPVAALAGAQGIGDPDLTLAELELSHIRAVLRACNDNQSEAARRLGIGRNTLARKLNGV